MSLWGCLCLSVNAMEVPSLGSAKSRDTARRAAVSIVFLLDRFLYCRWNIQMVWEAFATTSSDSEDLNLPFTLHVCGVMIGGSMAQLESADKWNAWWWWEYGSVENVKLAEKKRLPSGQVYKYGHDIIANVLICRCIWPIQKSVSRHWRDISYTTIRWQRASHQTKELAAAYTRPLWSKFSRHFWEFTPALQTRCWNRAWDWMAQDFCLFIYCCNSRRHVIWWLFYILKRRLDSLSGTVLVTIAPVAICELQRWKMSTLQLITSPKQILITFSPLWDQWNRKHSKMMRFISHSFAVICRMFLEFEVLG